MKSASAILALSALPVLAGEVAVSGDPYRPVGTLEVSQTWVRTGERPTLTWEIHYPQSATDFAEITPTGGLLLRQRTEVEVRVVGAAFQVGDDHTPLSVQTRVGSEGWTSIFLETDQSVQPDEVVLRRTVEAGERVDFSARASRGDGTWYSSRDTLTDDPAVTALKNGDPVPDYVPAYQQGDIASFLTQYISGDQKVTVGPRDVIYLFELYATEPSDSGFFDLQDMVVLVTFNDVAE